MSERKVLVVTQKCPYPPVDGGSLATWNMIRVLEKVAKVEVFMPSTEKHPVEENLLPREVTWHYYRVNLEDNRKRFPLKKFFVPLQLLQYVTEEGVRKLQELLHGGQYSCIFMESIYMGYLLERAGVREGYFLRTHNIEHEYWREVSEYSEGTGKKGITLGYSKLLKKYEVKIWKRARLVLHINRDEVERIKAEMGSLENVVYCPFVLSDNFFKETENMEYRDFPVFYFIGSFEWLPNLMGTVEFLRKVWPRIKEEFPQARMLIAGKRADLLRREIERDILPGIQIEGALSSSLSILRRGDVLINPVRFGSGVSTKVVESLGAGRYVITTPEGARGLNLGGDSESMGIAIYRDEEDIIECIKRCIDRRVRQRAGKRAREWVMENHSEEVAAEVVKKVLGWRRSVLW